MFEVGIQVPIFICQTSNLTLVSNQILKDVAVYQGNRETRWKRTNIVRTQQSYSVLLNKS